MKKAPTKKPTTVATSASLANATDKEAIVARLKRIEGQVRGLQKMVDESRSCADVLDQIASVESALKGVSRVVVKNHLRRCAARAMSSDDVDEREELVDELVGLIGR